MDKGFKTQIFDEFEKEQNNFSSKILFSDYEFGSSQNLDALNAFGVNKKIKGNLLDSESMLKIGFVEEAESWVWEREIKGIDLIFRVTIFKLNPKEMLQVSLLDKNTNTFYSYEKVLKTDPNNMYALSVKSISEKYLLYLQGNGIVSGYRKNDFIFV